MKLSKKSAQNVSKLLDGWLAEGEEQLENKKTPEVVTKEAEEGIKRVEELKKANEEIMKEMANSFFSLLKRR